MLPEQQIISGETTDSDGKYKSTKDCIQSLMPYGIRKVPVHLRQQE